MATVDDVRAIATALPRTSEHLIRDHVKFRVGRIVYASVSPDEERLGFGFPREERAAKSGGTGVTPSSMRMTIAWA